MRYICTDFLDSGLDQLDISITYLLTITLLFHFLSFFNFQRIHTHTPTHTPTHTGPHHVLCVVSAVVLAAGPRRASLSQSRGGRARLCSHRAALVHHAGQGRDHPHTLWPGAECHGGRRGHVRRARAELHVSVLRVSLLVLRCCKCFFVHLPASDCLVGI